METQVLLSVEPCRNQSVMKSEALAKAEHERKRSVVGTRSAIESGALQAMDSGTLPVDALALLSAVPF